VLFVQSIVTPATAAKSHVAQINSKR